MNHRKPGIGLRFVFALAILLILAFACFGCVQPVSETPPAGSPTNTSNDPVIVAVQFLSATQSGGARLSADTTALTLTFDVDPVTLTTDNIIITGADKGALSGTGFTRSLAVSNISVANGETVSVSVSSPAGYSISGGPKTAAVYRALAVGMHYQGGIIAYILQPGDPGYDAQVPHGLIAAEEDQSAGIAWSLALYTNTLVPGGTGTDLGTGASNTDKIIAQNGAGTEYAAGLARSYTGGGYTDWYLPSKDELHKIYENKSVLSGFMNGEGYWTSSENNSFSAWGQYFEFDSQGNWGKSHSQPVRAVRSF